MQYKMYDMLTFKSLMQYKVNWCNMYNLYSAALLEWANHRNHSHWGEFLDGGFNSSITKIDVFVPGELQVFTSKTVFPSRQTWEQAARFKHFSHIAMLGNLPGEQWGNERFCNNDKEVTTTCMPFVYWQRDPKNLQIPCMFLSFC